MKATTWKLDRLFAATCFSVGAVVLGVTSLAWACGSTGPGAAFISAPEPNRATASSQVLVTGANWVPNQAVLIHWEEVADGSEVGRAIPDRNGSVSAAVTVPGEATPGVYHLVAQQPGARQTTANPVPIEVLAPTSSGGQPVGPPPEGSSTGTSSRRTSGGSTDPAPPQQDPVAPSTQTTPSPTSSAAVTDDSPATGRQKGVPEAPPSSEASPVAVPTPGATQVVEVAGGPAPEVAPNNDAAREPERSPVQARSASGDLWGGFSNGRVRTTSRGLDSLESPAVGIGLAFETATALFVAGLFALLGGFLLAEFRRRRVRA